MPTRADHQLRTIRMAKDCRDLGARSRTIHLVTGLPTRELHRLLFPDSRATPRGRAPDSPEWYHGANLLYRAESSIFASIYRRLRDSGFGAGETLVGAYRHYQSICKCPSRISFDRAFGLASHTDGIWLAKCTAFSVVTCPICSSEHLAATGTVASAKSRCPFCPLVLGFTRHRRLQNAFPLHSLGDPLLVQLHMMALAFPDHHGDAEADADRDAE